MTERVGAKRCQWCGRPFEVTPGPGRPRLFCKQSCRQADYVARQRRVEVGLSEAELIVTRAQLDELRDKLYVLECAVDDVKRDLADGGDPAEAVDWLVEAANPLIGSADFT